MRRNILCIQLLYKYCAMHTLLSHPIKLSSSLISAHIEHIWETTNNKGVIGLGGDVGMVNVGNRSLEYPSGELIHFEFSMHNIISVESIMLLSCPQHHIITT